MAWTPPPPRAGHPYFMYESIFAQPGAIRLVVRNNGDTLELAASRLRTMERVLLLGIGTSWHAALVGEVLFRKVGGWGYRARALHSFEFKNYCPDPDPTTGVVVLTHRGTKRFSLEALEKAKGGGGVGVVITGKGSGEGTTAADHVLTTVDQERSGAHTVSYTTALALLVALAGAIGGHEAEARELEGVPDEVAMLLGQESWDELAARFKDRRRYYFVGGGPNVATAYEAALKMSETNHSQAQGFQVEQFLHGPWIGLESEDLVVVIAPPGPSYERCLTVARVAREVGAPVLALVQEGDKEIAPLSAYVIELPGVSEWLTPILSVVPLQLFAYFLAVHRGINPDTLRRDQEVYARAHATFNL